METAKAVQKGAIHLIASVIYSQRLSHALYICALLALEKRMFFGAVNYILG
jgi:hypothetical protein